MQSAKFDEAVRQNRRGFIFVAKEVGPQALDLVSARMLITNRREDTFRRVERWEGYSADFEALSLGASAPLYEARFNQAANGSLTLTFRRCPDAER
jgi:hypothetical protein